jgi:hypothetical protein
MEGLEWDVEFWYELLEPGATFETILISLSMKEIEALAFPAANELIVASLRERVGEVIEKLGGSAFIRLSSLSPKDAVKTNPKRLVELLELSSCAGNYVQEGDYVQELLAINRAQYEATRVSSGTEAIWMFQNSERCQRHLQNRLLDKTELRISLVVRRWAQIAPEMEFRGYVSDGQLVALSHYYKFLFTPAILLKAERVFEAVCSFFEKNIRSIPLQQFVCDFVVDRNTFAVQCIELNPWAPNTSSALFAWDEIELLRRNKGKPEFRFLRQPLPDAATRISPFWRTVLAIARAEKGQAGVPPHRVASVAAIAALLKRAKKKARQMDNTLNWPNNVESLIEQVEQRGFVTCPDLLCLGWKVLFVSGEANFLVPTALFLLWGLSFTSKQRALAQACWKSAEYLVQTGKDEAELNNLIHNQHTWMKANKHNTI